MSELKKCPFCGGEAKAISYDPYDGYQGYLTVWLIACKKCTAMLQRKTKEQAIEAWNRRTE